MTRAVQENKKKKNNNKNNNIKINTLNGIRFERTALIQIENVGDEILHR